MSLVFGNPPKIRETKAEAKALNTNKQKVKVTIHSQWGEKNHLLFCHMSDLGWEFINFRIFVIIWHLNNTSISRHHILNIHMWIGICMYIILQNNGINRSTGLACFYFRSLSWLWRNNYYCQLNVNDFAKNDAGLYVKKSNIYKYVCT